MLHPLLRVLGERLGRRLRRRGLVARRLRVALTYADHTAAARAVTLHAAALDAELWDAARRAFTQANARRLAVRSVSLTLDRLEEAEAQLELWEDGGTADERDAEAPTAAARSVPPLQSAVDRIRTRYGTGAIGPALIAARAALPPQPSTARSRSGLARGNLEPTPRAFTGWTGVGAGSMFFRRAVLASAPRDGGATETSRSRRCASSGRKMISIALIEDNRLVREGIASLLNDVTDLEVVAAGSSGDMALLRT